MNDVNIRNLTLTVTPTLQSESKWFLDVQGITGEEIYD